MNLGQGSLKRTPWWCWLAMLVAAAMMLPGGAFVADAKEKRRSRTTAADAKSGRYAERSYKLGDVVKTTAAQFKIDDAAAKQFLMQHLQSMCPGPWDESRTLTIDLATTDDGKGTRMAKVVDDASVQRHMRWSGKKLVVKHTSSGHERMRTAIETLREYGLHRIEVEAHFITGPTDLIRSLSSQWVVPEAHHGQTVTPRIGRPLPSATTEQQSSAGVSVEKRVPIMLEVLSESRRDEVLARLKKNPDANILMAPKVVLFNGQSSVIQDTMQRPFVVGMKDGAPQVRVVSSGVELQLRPILRSSERLWLDYELKHSDISDVLTTEIKTQGKDEPTTLHVPEVVTARIDSSVEITLGKTLLVGGLRVADGGKDTSLLLLLRATRVDTSKVADVARTDRLMFGAGVNSDAGVTGRFTFDPRVNQASADQLIAARDESIANLVDEFNALMEAKRYSEAQVIARQAAKLFPDSPVTKTMLKKATLGRQVQEGGKELPGPYYMEDEAHYFAPGPEFKLVRENEGLERRLKVNFDRTPLRKALAEVGKLAGINLRIEERTLKARAIDVDAPVTMQLQQEIKAKSILRLILAPHDLTYVEKDEIVTITHVGYGMIAKAYNVAELVVPIPGSKQLDTSEVKARLKDKTGVATADFDTLIELIVSTIEPQSWDKNRGPGQIQAFDTNLSVVVSQTQEVHEQIADLLEQLRRLQDVQVTLDCQSVELTPDAYKQLTKKCSVGTGRPWAKLTDIEAFFLLQLVDGQKGVSRHRGPKVTLFNGQGVQLPWAASKSKKPAESFVPLQVVAFAGADRQSTRLQITPQTANEDERETFTLSVGQGATLMLAMDRLVGSKKQPKKHILLLITPRVIVIRETEEQLKLSHE